MTTPRLTDAELAELQGRSEKAQDASMEGRTFAESVHRDFMRAAFHQAANPATVLCLLAELKAVRLSDDDLLSLAIAKQLIGEVLQERKPDVDATDAQRAAWRRIADCLPVLSRLLSTHRAGGGR